jgi:hypothetical protein
MKTLDSEQGHLVLPFDVDLPLTVRYESATGRLVIDSPTLRIGTNEKAGILRLTFSPEATHSLLQAVHKIEEEYGATIGQSTKSQTQ